MVKAAGADTFDAILFAMDESKPRLVKVPWKLVPGEDDYDPPWRSPVTDIWFKYTDKFVKPLYFHRWGINGPDLGRNLCFEYDDNSMINGSPLNRCILEITGGRAGHSWCGNILGFRMKSPPYAVDDEFTNVDMEEDLKPFVTYFDEYGKVMPAR